MSALMRYATPFITGLFLASLISGIALFFHIGPGGFHGMHEWLSMVLILPFVLHLMKNWRPMSVYFGKPVFAVAMALSLAASLVFFMPMGTTGGAARAGGPPQMQLARAVLNGTPDKVAALFATTPEALVERLRAAGFADAAAGLSLHDAAAKAGKDDAAIAAALLAAR